MSRNIMQAETNKTAIIVLGMHRSGTSAMARVLSLAGVQLPSRLMLEAQDNPTGFWEPQDVVDLNEKILRQLDISWDDVFSGVEKSHLEHLDGGLVDEAVKVISQNYGESELVVLKDPRISVLTKFWRRALLKAGYSVRFIIMVRNPLEVAASLTARNGFSREKSLLLWSSYMVAAERDTRDESRIFVSYESLLANWRAVLDRIESTLAVSLPRRTSIASVETDRFLKSDLRHHVVQKELDDDATVWLPAKNLYDWFSAASDGRALPNVSPENVDDDLATLNGLVGPIMAEFQIELRKLEAELAKLSGEYSRYHLLADGQHKALEAALIDSRGTFENYEKAATRRIEEIASASEKAQRDLVEQLAGKDADIAALELNLSASSEEALRSAQQWSLERQALDEAVAGLSAKLAERQAIEEAIRLELGEANTRIASLSSRLELATAEHRALSAELVRLEEHALGIAQNLSSSQARTEELEARLASVSALLTVRDDKLAELEALLIERDARAELDRAEIEGLQNDLALQKTLRASTDAYIEAVNEDARLKQAEISAAQLALQAAGSQVEALKSELDLAVVGADALRAEIASTVEEREQASAEAKRLAGALSTLHEQNQALAEQHQLILGRYTSLEGEVQRASHAHSVSLEENLKLEEELSASISREEGLSKVLSDIVESKQQSDRKLDQLSKDLEIKSKDLEGRDLLLDEMRMAASLESRTLKRHLHEQTEALRTLQDQHRQLVESYNAVNLSTSWRLTAPLRSALGRAPGLALRVRQGLKLIYWTATLQLPKRLQLRKAFLEQNQARSVEAEALAYQEPVSKASSVPAGSKISFVAPTRAAVETAPSAPSTPSAPGAGQRFGWKTATTPDLPDEVLGLYERRPDDSVPREAARGAAFLDRFDLLSAQPRFHQAVAYLNAKRATCIGPRSAETPVVSIIIPIYGQLSYTLNCIDSLLEHSSAYSFEIIIGNDVSPDDSEKMLSLIDKVKVVTHEENGGFIINCNKTAMAARGDFLVFLNNDTRVVEGWLDELMSTMTQQDGCGLVGSKLFYPDGTLQEAGGIIWRDGSAWNYGREQDPNAPEYCYARQVDYISGASILIRTQLWNALSGFDEHYKPAYCEDADLALRVRQQGLGVWLQPLSRAIHYEGRTSGTDLTKGVKAYQVVNMAKLFERWAPALAKHRPNAVEPSLEKDRDVAKRVLIVDSTTPTPDQDAGSVVTEATIKIYQALGYKVTFIPRDNFLYQPRYTQALQRMGVECIYAPYYIDFGAFMEKYGASFDVIQLFRIGVADKCLADIRKYAPQAPVLFHNVDLHYLRMERQALVTGDADLVEQAKAMKVRELALLDDVDCTIVTSPVEEEILKQEKPHASITVFPYMVDVVGTAVGYEPRKHIMFLGGYRHTPNIDAAEWFVTEIWPRLETRVPEASLWIVGAHPTDSIKALASDRVIVTGMVDELAPYFDQTKVFVAPIRYGAGIKGKVATSLAHGLPVVATSCAAEGMYMMPERDILIADDVDTFVEQVLRVYDDPAEWERLSHAGQAFVAEHNALPKGRRTILGAIEMGTRLHQAKTGHG